MLMQACATVTDFLIKAIYMSVTINQSTTDSDVYKKWPHQ